MKNIQLILGLVCSIIASNFNAQSQVITTNLVAKMDVIPTFSLWDGNKTLLMGYTKFIGSKIDLPSPILEYYEGDSVNLNMRNFSQSAPHTIHLHGLDVNQENDGVPHLSFEIPHDSTGTYSFVAPHPGTYLYHCHVVSPLHVQAGMYGLLIVRPADKSKTTWSGGYAYDKEYAWLASEIDTFWHQYQRIHDLSAGTSPILDYKPQYFLLNGKSENQLESESITSSINKTVFLRLANIGNYGNTFVFPSATKTRIISSDGRPLPSIDFSDTLTILPGERYEVLLSSEVLLNESISVSYFNLNTQIVENIQSISITITQVNSISIIEPRGMKIIPNPASSAFRITFNASIPDDSEITVYNSSGQKVYARIISDQTSLNINTLSWGRGLYFITLNSGGQFTHQKVMLK